MMNINRIARLTLVLMLAITLLAVSLFALNRQTAQPAQAQGKTEGYASYLFLSSANGTGNATGTGKVVADYGWMDCYQITDFALTQHTQVTFAHSPNNTDWVSGTAFAAVNDTDSVIYVGVPVTGTYMRASLVVTSVNPVTVTIRCTAKDLTR